MTAWHEKALELFPDMRPEIQASESVGRFWIELASRFHRHYKAGLCGEEDSPKLIRAICLFAIWCTRSESQETREAAWIEFYEGLPKFAIECQRSIYGKIVRDLVLNLGIEEIERSTGTIGGFMESGQLKKFLSDARQEDADRQQRSRKR
jgi:hypothetical protein